MQRNMNTPRLESYNYENVLIESSKLSREKTLHAGALNVNGVQHSTSIQDGIAAMQAPNEDATSRTHE